MNAIARPKHNHDLRFKAGRYCNGETHLYVQSVTSHSVTRREQNIW